MSNAIALGPLVLSLPVISLLVSYFTVSWVVGRIAQRMETNWRWVKRVAELAMLIGVVAARLGFVVLNWESYTYNPWTALFFWQPGYSAPVGMIAAFGFAAWRIYQARDIGRRESTLILITGIATGVAIFYLVLGSARLFVDRDGLGPGDLVSDFALRDLNGTDVRLSNFQGRPVILNFWATWCGPCRREMPLLDAVNRRYASLGLVVVGIDVGESRETVQTYIDTIGIGYPIWVDSPGLERTQDIFNRYGGVGLPTTVFIGRQGRIQRQYVGELSAAFVDSEIKPMLAETKQ